MGDIALRIENIISEKLGVDKSTLGPETAFATDLGADDLDIVELTIAFSKEFGIEITDVDVEAMHTIDDARQLISGRALPM